LEAVSAEAEKEAGKRGRKGVILRGRKGGHSGYGTCQRAENGSAPGDDPPPEAENGRTRSGPGTMMNKKGFAPRLFDNWIRFAPDPR
jgi:hypothetical protein